MEFRVLWERVRVVWREMRNDLGWLTAAVLFLSITWADSIGEWAYLAAWGFGGGTFLLAFGWAIGLAIHANPKWRKDRALILSPLWRWITPRGFLMLGLWGGIAARAAFTYEGYNSELLAFVLASFVTGFGWGRVPLQERVAHRLTLTSDDILEATGYKRRKGYRLYNRDS